MGICDDVAKILNATLVVSHFEVNYVWQDSRYIKNVSWALGLGIPAALMLFSCVVYFIGSKQYVKVKATGSPVTSIVQVISVAIKKKRLNLEDYPFDSLFSYISPNLTPSSLTRLNSGFLTTAIITPQDEINPNASASDPWSLCSIQQVEEVKCLPRVIPICLSGILYYVALVQQNTILVFQALQSDRTFFNTNFKIPAASYIIFTMLSLTIWLPIYDRKIVPTLRKFTAKEGGITLLQRMGIGMFISILCMLVSGIVEERRRTMALTKPIGIEPRKGAISSMSAVWLIPQLLLAGLSDAFGLVGQVEFYYKQFPENMRSLAGSLSFCGLAGSSYFSSLLDFCYNLFFFCLMLTQIYPKSWTAIYMALDNVGIWNIRSENWGRQYLGQQFYLRVYTSSNSWRDEYPVPRNALLCGRARGRHTRPF